MTNHKIFGDIPDHEERVVKSPKGDYGIPQKLFVYLWETSSTVDEALKKMRGACEDAGRDPITMSAMLARVAGYRASGVPLKNMPRSQGPLKASDLVALIEEIRKCQESGEIPAPPEKISPAVGPSSDKIRQMHDQMKRRK